MTAWLSARKATARLGVSLKSNGRSSKKKEEKKVSQIDENRVSSAQRPTEVNMCLVSALIGRGDVNIPEDSRKIGTSHLGWPECRSEMNCHVGGQFGLQSFQTRIALLLDATFVSGHGFKILNRLKWSFQILLFRVANFQRKRHQLISASQRSICTFCEGCYCLSVCNYHIVILSNKPISYF